MRRSHAASEIVSYNHENLLINECIVKCLEIYFGDKYMSKKSNGKKIIQEAAIEAIQEEKQVNTSIYDFAKLITSQSHTKSERKSIVATIPSVTFTIDFAIHILEALYEEQNPTAGQLIAADFDGTLNLSWIDMNDTEHVAILNEAFSQACYYAKAAAPPVFNATTQRHYDNLLKAGMLIPAHLPKVLPYVAVKYHNLLVLFATLNAASSGIQSLQDDRRMAYKLTHGERPSKTMQGMGLVNYARANRPTFTTGSMACANFLTAQGFQSTE